MHGGKTSPATSSRRDDDDGDHTSTSKQQDLFEQNLKNAYVSAVKLAATTVEKVGTAGKQGFSISKQQFKLTDVLGGIWTTE